jgi:hypothetical protein
MDNGESVALANAKLEYINESPRTAPSKKVVQMEVKK